MTTTSTGASASALAADRPAKPAPMMTTRWRRDGDCRTLAISGGPLRLEAAQNQHQLAGIRSLGVVGVDLGIGDDAIRLDDVTRGHWKGPTRLAVADGQIVAKALVDGDQIIGQAVAQPELVRERVAVVAEDQETERVLPLGLAPIGRGLRRR